MFRVPPAHQRLSLPGLPARTRDAFDLGLVLDEKLAFAKRLVQAVARYAQHTAPAIASRLAQRIVIKLRVDPFEVFELGQLLEGAYFGLAQASVGQVGTGPNAVSGSVDMRALGIYGVAFVPLSKRVEVFVKAGGASWDADLTRNTTTATADGFDALYGLGISYAFTKTFKGTADWEVIDSPNPEFSTFSLGFKWEFK